MLQIYGDTINIRLSGYRDLENDLENVLKCDFCNLSIELENYNHTHEDYILSNMLKKFILKNKKIKNITIIGLKYDYCDKTYTLKYIDLNRFEIFLRALNNDKIIRNINLNTKTNHLYFNKYIRNKHIVRKWFYQSSEINKLNNILLFFNN